MTYSNQNFSDILRLYKHLSFEEQILILRELMTKLKQPEPEPLPQKKKSSLLDLYGIAEGVYGDSDAYIKEERKW
jgi:hypothetical protein